MVVLVSGSNYLKNIDVLELYKECTENDLAIVPGKVFFVDESIYSNYIRLSFGQIPMMR